VVTIFTTCINFTKSLHSDHVAYVLHAILQQKQATTSLNRSVWCLQYRCGAFTVRYELSCMLGRVDSTASCRDLVSWTYKHTVPTVCNIRSNVKGTVNPRVEISGPYLRYFSTTHTDGLRKFTKYLRQNTWPWSGDPKWGQTKNALSSWNDRFDERVNKLRHEGIQRK
jgi:hypothetical protein